MALSPNFADQRIAEEISLFAFFSTLNDDKKSSLVGDRFTAFFYFFRLYAPVWQ